MDSDPDEVDGISGVDLMGWAVMRGGASAAGGGGGQVGGVVSEVLSVLL